MLFFLQSDEALQVAAIMSCVDVNGINRVQGETWMVRGIKGAYLPGINEICGEKFSSLVIPSNKAIHFFALTNHKDLQSGAPRKAGEQWLLTREESSTYLPDPLNCKVVKEVELTVLFAGEYCFIVNPRNQETGQPEWGAKKLISGPASFFLQPHEVLDKKEREILCKENALLLSSTEETRDHNNILRNAGEQWIIYGPGEYIPSTGINIDSRLNAFFKYEPLKMYLFAREPFVLIFVSLLIFFIKFRFL